MAMPRFAEPWTTDEVRKKVKLDLCEVMINPRRPKPSKSAVTDTTARRPLPLVWAPEIEVGKFRAYLRKGPLEASSMSVVYGPSNSRKDFFAVDVTCHTVARVEWRRMLSALNS